MFMPRSCLSPLIVWLSIISIFAAISMSYLSISDSPVFDSFSRKFGVSCTSCELDSGLSLCRLLASVPIVSVGL